ncbi:aldehyde dehydrogenase 3b1 [Colletotrichum truncatum]|uniref:Aldehyde dehydrogenase 3b1 n=1 Tax=Colletotrichum truncatum TaxID=5467 RepID=A0ACC3ZFR3_COLTU|nr:aldehyde dehydrogenase 3b1 [Colletotrichum truncatum]KAF6801847.1 aldehyde dehydrogenase 3b1 [Colletotrichum truncatum]
MDESITSEKFDAIYKQLRSTFLTGKTKSIQWRKWQLKQLYWLLDENEDALLTSLANDLHRSKFESLLTDINDAKNAILEAVSEVETWAQGNAPPKAGIVYGTFGKAWIRKEPRGLVLIIGAWNFPISTLINVAIAAIAAGNAVILKPSEMASHTEKLLSELVPRYMDTLAVALIRATPAKMSFILDHKFDFIFYTGSTRVGRIIASAAAKHITPVALELGGQAPGIVTKHADLDLVAKRIVNAKLSNLGQVCICVNHVFAHPEIYDQFTARVEYWAKKLLESGTATLCRIINEKHFDRLQGLIQKTEGKVVFSGDHVREDKLIYPTIVTNVKMTDSLLSEELFGPVLPIIKADTVTALETLKNSPHPLALYIFSESKQEIDHILDSTQSGGVTINDVGLHADVSSAPFGGVGDSGYGCFHGKWGFDTFSHNRSVVTVPGWIERFTVWRYPPFDVANRSSIDPTKPSFKKGETMEDQRIGGSFLSKIPIIGLLF